MIDKVKTPTLKEKLAQQLTKGAVNLSSADVAGFDKPEKGEAVIGDATLKAPTTIGDVDPLMAVGVAGDSGKSVGDNIKNTATTEKLMAKLATDGSLLPEEINITQAEKDLFLDCVVTGKRFELSFSLFNDKIKGRFRSRSQIESAAILARLNWETENKHVHNALEFATRLRNMLLTAQVAEVRNTKYDVMKEPLYRTVKGLTETVEPGWLTQVDGWMGEHEGLVSAIYRELQLFERKYWVMVNNAGDQNFWNPAEST